MISHAEGSLGELKTDYEKTAYKAVFLTEDLFRKKIKKFLKKKKTLIEYISMRAKGA